MKLEVLFTAALSIACGAAPLPKQAIELNTRGARALAEGDLESADSALSVALEYSPHFVDALVNLGLVECQRGNFERARTLLLRARRLNPDVAQPHHALGVLAERERRPDLASEHYWEALHVDPGFAPARENLGRLQFDAGMFDAASLTFKKLIQVAPNAPSGYAGLSEALLRLGRTNEAQEVVARASERFPNDPGIALLGARCAIRRGEFERAQADLEQLSERGDEYAAAALGWLATLYLARGEADVALQVANRSLGLVPDEPVALYAAAQALAALGDRRAPAWLERRRKLGQR
ncbi:MAG TPA: tetratricopeptide repeat protein [Polyangiaceae bacterium]|nr:tetratricopeptide repeat protein [Polyangiaceae bacterium]